MRAPTGYRRNFVIAEALDLLEKVKADLGEFRMKAQKSGNERERKRERERERERRRQGGGIVKEMGECMYVCI